MMIPSSESTEEDETSNPDRLHSPSPPPSTSSDAQAAPLHITLILPPQYQYQHDASVRDEHWMDRRCLRGVYDHLLDIAKGYIVPHPELKPDSDEQDLDLIYVQVWEWVSAVFFLLFPHVLRPLCAANLSSTVVVGILC